MLTTMASLTVPISLTLYVILGVSCGEANTDFKIETCPNFKFAYSPQNPYTAATAFENTDDDILNLDESCAMTQRCLGVNDEEMLNLLIASTQLWSSLEDRLSEYRPTSANESIEFANIIFDDNSQYHIHGIGDYVGAVDIGNYLSVPSTFVSNVGLSGVEAVASVKGSPSNYRIHISLVRNELWNHVVSELNSSQTSGVPASLDVFDQLAPYLRRLGLTNATLLAQWAAFGVPTTWKIKANFYPCSIIQKETVTRFPDYTAQEFSNSARVHGTIEAMCVRVMESCTETNQQFDSVENCTAYYTSLPLHDPTCQEKFGPYTTKGESLMCKYLHQFMAPQQPELHCFHAGPNLPDARGVTKCAPEECMDANSSDSATSHSATSVICSPKNLEELTIGVIRALHVCLPAINGANCVSSNCTHALNTYLGRLTENGVVCACRDTLMPSALLQILNIDAEVLLRRCGGRGVAVGMPSCLRRESASADDRCEAPLAYLTKDGCQMWDWEKVEQQMMDQIGPDARLYGRIATSQTIASVECSVFSPLYAMFHNVRFPQQSHSMLYWRDGSSNETYIHPAPRPSAVFHHADVVAAMRTQQRRDHMSIASSDGCHYGGWSQIAPKITITTQDTHSVLHNATRQFALGFWRGLNTTSLKVYDDVQFNASEDSSIYTALCRSLAGTLFQRTTLDDPNTNWNNRTYNLLAAGSQYFLPEYVHRSGGMLAASAYLLSWRAFADEVRKLIPVSEMSSLLSAAGLDTELTELEAYTTAAFLAPSSGAVQFAFDLIEFIREDPCKLRQIWDRNPTRFILEFSRWAGSVLGFIADTSDNNTASGSRFYSIMAANWDPTVFPNPHVFDPTRDLSQVLSFNVLEGDWAPVDSGRRTLPGDYHADVTKPTTMHRYCPARNLVVQWITSIVPRFLPQIACSSGNVPVFDDVHFTKGPVNVTTNASTHTLEVYKSELDGSSDLVIALHGYPLFPLSFSKIISKLRQSKNQLKTAARYSAWAVTAPGWTRDSGLATCTLAAGGDTISALVRDAHATGRWKRIFLLGHGMGGLIAWMAARDLDSKVLTGLITIGSTHPQVWANSFRQAQIPISEVYFYPNLNPFQSVAMNTPRVFAKLFQNYSWYTLPLQREHERFINQVGGERMACYYRNNFVMSNGVLQPTFTSELEQIYPNTNILMVHGESDSLFVTEFGKRTISHLGKHPGHILDVYKVGSGTASSMVFDDDHVSEIANRIVGFDNQIRALPLSAWSLSEPPTTISGGLHEENVYAYTLAVAIFMTVAMVVLGIALEFYLGPILVDASARTAVRLGYMADSGLGVGKNGLHHLSKLLMAPLAMSAVVSQSWAMAVPFTIAIFHVGFPEVVTSFLLGARGIFHTTSKPTDTDASDPSPFSLVGQVEGTAGTDMPVGSKVTLSLFARILLLLNCLAYIVHHTSGCMIFTAICTGQVAPEVFAFVIIATGLQHAVTFVGFMNLWAYNVVGLAIEIWLNLETFYVLPILRPFPLVASWMLLSSHWLWVVLRGLIAVCGVLLHSGLVSRRQSEKFLSNDPRLLRSSITFSRAIKRNRHKRESDVSEVSQLSAAEQKFEEMHAQFVKHVASDGDSVAYQPGDDTCLDPIRPMDSGTDSDAPLASVSVL
eukprot:m.356136 g.356136  ORF g.356136 m.356136 type:complete len:1633 (+) comp20746_c0_seq2:97-4995(+)